MPRTDRLSNYKTTIGADATHTIVTYHRTQIVRFNSQEIVLNFGGWDTFTTRRKMNQASRQFGLGYSVFRNKGLTYIQYGDNAPFLYDGNTVILPRPQECWNAA